VIINVIKNSHDMDGRLSPISFARTHLKVESISLLRKKTLIKLFSPIPVCGVDKIDCILSCTYVMNSFSL